MHGSCRGRHRSSLLGKNRLVPVLILFCRLPLNIGRHRHISDHVEPAIELLVGSVKQKPDGSATGGGVVYDFSHQILAKVELVSDRKSTRLNSSHVAISYAVFCL